MENGRQVCVVLPFPSQRGIFFSELTSEQSRKLFKKFVNKWNKGLLKKVRLSIDLIEELSSVTKLIALSFHSQKY